jgi:hypothetical protein
MKFNPHFIFKNSAQAQKYKIEWWQLNEKHLKEKPQISSKLPYTALNKYIFSVE